MAEALDLSLQSHAQGKGQISFQWEFCCQSIILYIFNAVNIGPIHPEKIVKAAIVAIDDLLGG